MKVLTCPTCGMEFFALDGITGVEHPRPGSIGHTWVWPTHPPTEGSPRDRRQPPRVHARGAGR